MLHYTGTEYDIDNNLLKWQHIKLEDMSKKELTKLLQKFAKKTLEWNSWWEEKCECPGSVQEDLIPPLSDLSVTTSE